MQNEELSIVTKILRPPTWVPRCLCRLREELQAARERCERQASAVSRGQVDRDVQLQALQQAEEKMRQELQQRKEDIDRWLNSPVIV